MAGYFPPLGHNRKMDKSALFHLEYGLYLLSAREEKDNACIINPANLTHDMITATKKFNVRVLSESAPFSLYSDFGYVSGRQKDKFYGRTDIARSENGIYYLTDNTTAYLSAEVKNTIHLQTHTLFLGEVTEAVSLSDSPSVTYNYYQKNIKPQKKDEGNSVKKGYICEVCGYVYEGDVLPDDYICPVCKHGAEAFRPL